MSHCEKRSLKKRRISLSGHLDPDNFILTQLMPVIDAKLTEDTMYQEDESKTRVKLNIQIRQFLNRVVASKQAQRQVNRYHGMLVVGRSANLIQNIKSQGRWAVSDSDHEEGKATMSAEALDTTMTLTARTTKTTDIAGTTSIATRHVPACLRLLLLELQKNT
ncbi:hypothetical protein CHS0354_024477 [Potamilus streckersoni]|uniref:Uncharacterized protein n=1 Tax=Potamilus streckersoni TaxID=2493646 RepID=A0AAE0TLH9_9BIVA|nr:hypothetical protein CHS0354_024477 [Potamilus streckersoni]